MLVDFGETLLLDPANCKALNVGPGTAETSQCVIVSQTVAWLGPRGGHPGLRGLMLDLVDCKLAIANG